MNVIGKSSIEIGRPYKYGELCEIFGEETYHGNQMARQIEKWKLECDLEKIPGTRLYVVNDVYKVGTFYFVYYIILY